MPHVALFALLLLLAATPLGAGDPARAGEGAANPSAYDDRIDADDLDDEDDDRGPAGMYDDDDDDDELDDEEDSAQGPDDDELADDDRGRGART